MRSKIDLHSHTNYSDGFNSPKALIDKAKERGIEILSITDHDNLAAIREASEYGRQVGVEIIPGVEISSDIMDREIHILGYFVEPGNPELEKVP